MTARRIVPGLADLPERVDLVVVGLGVTGAGVALDAVTRGLSVLAVDAHDLAFGTSRWSSKLVHGGLRYLARGQVGIAHESAVERGILLDRTAPHLTRPLPMLLPLTGSVSRAQAAVNRAGLAAGDLLRRTAHTGGDVLPRPRRLGLQETRLLAPGLRAAGLRGGLLSWDGQLEDDARLVVTLGRTAAWHGAEVRTRARVLAASGEAVTLRDELTGRTTEVTARAVVNATGVWAGTLGDVRLRPSRGTHLVLRGEDLDLGRVAVMAPVPGCSNRYALLLPQPDGNVYVGLTDEPADGPVPDVPEATDAEVDWLLDVAGTVLERAPGRGDVVGAFAGLRPLLDAEGETADLSRRHAVLTGSSGLVTVVGGKLTTYRRMAEEAVDAAVVTRRLDADPCRTADLPLLGAAPRDVLAGLAGPERLVRRFGTEAGLVVDTAREVTGLSADEVVTPLSDAVPVTLAELVFGVTHEGATDVADLLDRRTRVGLVPADRAVAVPLAERALALAQLALSR